MPSPELVNQIREERPFSHFITISNIEPISAKGAESGQAAFIDTDKGRFKLRRCKKEDVAAQIENNVRKFPKIFPKFYGRDGQYLLMEALVGYKNLTPQQLRENARKIGRICAEIHKEEEVGDHDQVLYFQKRLGNIRDRGVIDEVLYRNAKAKYESLLKEVDAKVLLDMNDIHDGNFMINDHGDLLFVDEEGISYRMKGLGVGKLLPKLDASAWEEFKRGYSEIHDGGFFTPDYIALIQLVESVRAIEYRSALNRSPDEYAQDLVRLKKIVG